MTEEPKLYDYYFYAAEDIKGDESVSTIVPLNRDTDILDAWSWIVGQAIENLGTRRIKITAFNFIKTGP